MSEQAPLPDDDETDLPTRVAQWVAAGIIDGRWPTGQRLNEVHIAQELGISRAPVREALRTLGEQGMVTYQARIGCVVNEFSPKTVEDLYAVRAAIERWCVTEGVSRLTDEDIEQMERYLIPMESAWVRRDYPAFYTHAWAMREIIHARSGNEVAVTEIRKLRSRLHQLPLVLHSIPEHSEWVLRRHQDIVTAARARDAEAVADIIVEILTAAGRYVREAYEDRFTGPVENRPRPRPGAAAEDLPKPQVFYGL
ncbi:GntR family transcriptional regulator [Microbacterium soli]|uniref:GntR family transcriptional regulator n=1 Tax=Microbacterium soli TaxID=446075 RepID=A0ABP7N4G7_9MICO